MAANAPAPGRLRCCSRCNAIYRSDFPRCPIDGAAIDEREDDPLIGATLGEHYVIEALVGEGAMGRVYRAHHARLARRAFAVKVLIGDLASTLAMRLRFTQEAEAASGLDHPNVVRVTDFGRTEAGLLFIVMDYVEGATLAANLDAGPTPAAEVIAIARGLCDGLAHAHARGLVHRDFKPDNVIVADGVPRIADFGLAIAANEDDAAARLTSVGATVGTPAYSAPEQAAGGSVDGRADQFSLGVTLFELLAGVLPFTGTVVELMYQNATAPTPAIAARAPGVEVPPALEAIVQRLMAKRPEDRYADLTAVRAALDALDRPAPERVVPPGAPTVSVRVPRRSWRGMGVAVAALVAVAAIAFAITRGGDDDRGGARAEIDAGAVAVAVMPIDAAALVDLEPIDAGVAPEPEPDAGTITAVDPGAVPLPPGPRPPRPLPPSPLPIDAGVDEPPIDAAPRPKPTPPPVDAAPPPPPPKPTPPPVDAAPPPPKPAVIVDARAAIADLSVRGSLTASQVRRGVDRHTSAVAACYRPAATRASRSPSARVTVSFTIDEDGGVRDLRASGGGLPGLDACVRGAFGSMRAVVAPDVGTVAVSFVVTYQPESP